MAKLITHKFVSAIPDGTDATIVRPSNWNDTHDVTGVAESGVNTDITSMTGITGGISSPDYIAFDTTYATPLTAGQLGWNGNDTLGLGMIGGNVVQHIGEDTFFYVKASATITKGQLCMFTGTVGSSGVLTAAPATAIPFAEAIIGVAAENIANNGFGLIQNTGTLKGVNTSAFLDGDILYYNSAVAGGFTKTFPASGPIVLAAAVGKAGSGGSGILIVRISFQTRVNAGTGISVVQANDEVTVTNTSPNTYNPAAVAITGGSITGVTGVAANANIQEFTTAGTSTWTKPAGAKLVYIVCQGAGGGGGAGYKQIAVPVNAAISGGGGGGTGGWSELLIPATLLGSTETVTTGLGGTGGASVTVAGGSNAGNAGGNSSFGSWCIARGGVAGVSGTTGTSGGGSGTNNTSNYIAINIGTNTLTGAGVTAIRGQTGSAGNRGGKSGGGGGSGGGIVAATPAALAGGIGGEGGAGIKSTNTATTGGGGTAGTSAVPNAGAGSNSTNEYIGGDGGGGGASQITANGGNGGNGGNSAGGGGGGACQNAYNSGAGGNGGDGSVMVITFF